MPAIGPVYQPTTYNVDYLPQSEWPQQPRGNKFTRFIESIQSKPKECYLRVLLISVAVIVVLFAIYLIFGYADVFSGDYARLLFIGLLIIATGLLVSLGIYCIKYKTVQFSFPSFMRKEGLTRQMNGQRSGQTSVLNPSTDLLVTSAQYGPVVEAPPTMPEEDETRNLMSNDNKESIEENDERPLETDPRIVLRPATGHIEEA